jgi:hypothetical protein
LAKVNELIEKPENVREANRTAEKSITLLRNSDDIFPLTAEKANKTLFVVVAADDDAVEGIAFMPEVQRRAPRAKIVRLDSRSTVEEYQKVVREAEQFDAIVIAPFVKRAALKGTVALPENQTNFIKQMIALNKPVGIVAFGSPYLIVNFPKRKITSSHTLLKKSRKRRRSERCSAKFHSPENFLSAFPEFLKSARE